MNGLMREGVQYIGANTSGRANRYAVPNSAAKQAIGNDPQSTIQAYAIIKY